MDVQALEGCAEASDTEFGRIKLPPACFAQAGVCLRFLDVPDYFQNNHMHSKDYKIGNGVV